MDGSTVKTAAHAAHKSPRHREERRRRQRRSSRAFLITLTVLLLLFAGLLCLLIAEYNTRATLFGRAQFCWSVTAGQTGLTLTAPDGQICLPWPAWSAAAARAGAGRLPARWQMVAALLVG